MLETEDLLIEEDIDNRSQTYRDIYRRLNSYTNGFSIEYGKFPFNTKSELESAESILKDHYNKVNKKGLDYNRINLDGVDYVIEFKEPINNDEVEEDFAHGDELKYMPNKAPTAGPLAGGIVGGMAESVDENLELDERLYLDKKRKALANTGFKVDGLVEEEILNLYQDVCGVEPYDKDKIKKEYNLFEALQELYTLNEDYLYKGSGKCDRCGTIINYRDAYVINDHDLTRPQYICKKCYSSSDELLREPISNNGEDNIKITEEVHSELNPKLWSDGELKPQVKEKLENIVKVFDDNLKEDGIELDVKDIVVIGSNANYNYNNGSDIDLHIVADTSVYENQEDLAMKLYQAYKTLFNNKFDPVIYGCPVEIYVEPDSIKANSNGMYSLNTGWIKEPVKTEIPEVDKELLNNKLKPFIDRFNKADTIEDIENLIDDIYLQRQRGILKDGEYSIDNLVFKEFRNKGYLQKLKDKKVELENKDMSLESLQEAYLNGGIDVRSLADNLYDFMFNNEMYVDIQDYFNGPMDSAIIEVIVKGDWKHDHIRFNNLVDDFAKENNLKVWKIDEEEIGDSGDDSYEARHTVYLVDKDKYDTLDKMRGMFNAKDDHGSYKDESLKSSKLASDDSKKLDEEENVNNTPLAKTKKVFVYLTKDINTGMPKSTIIDYNVIDGDIEDPDFDVSILDKYIDGRLRAKGWHAEDFELIDESLIGEGIVDAIKFASKEEAQEWIDSMNRAYDADSELSRLNYEVQKLDEKFKSLADAEKYAKEHNYFIDSSNNGELNMWSQDENGIGKHIVKVIDNLYDEWHNKYYDDMKEELTEADVEGNSTTIQDVHSIIEDFLNGCNLIDIEKIEDGYSIVCKPEVYESCDNEDVKDMFSSPLQLTIEDGGDGLVEVSLDSFLESDFDGFTDYFNDPENTIEREKDILLDDLQTWLSDESIEYNVKEACKEYSDNINEMMSRMSKRFDDYGEAKKFLLGLSDRADGRLDYHDTLDDSGNTVSYYVVHYYGDGKVDEKLTETITEEVNDKAHALANYLGYDNDSMVDSGDNEIFTTYDDSDYIVLTGDEAYNRAVDEIKMVWDDLGIDSFTLNFQKWILDNAVNKEWFDQWIEKNNKEAEEDDEPEDILSTEDSVQTFRDIFGDEEFSKVISDKDLVDLDKVAEEAISIDGPAHFISSYDGQEIDLGNGLYAYRLN